MGGFCPGGFCPGDFVLGGILFRGILSGGFCPGGFVRGDFVLEPFDDLPYFRCLAPRGAYRFSKFLVGRLSKLMKI